MILLALANTAITPGGMALGGWRMERRMKKRVLSCGSVWGRIAPPPGNEFVGGGVILGASTLYAYQQWINGRQYPQA
jgi:hypothetical protein